MKKKIKTLYLHVGGIKTGSTSIQEFSYSQRELLLERGIYYPEIIPFEHCATFPLVCLKEPKNFPPILMYYNHLNRDELNDYVNEIKCKWVEEFEKCNVDKFIISDELLSKRIEYGELDLDVLKTFLYDYFEEVKVICYVRDTLGLVKSVMQQSIKNGKRAFDINDKKLKLQPALYKTFIPEYINMFGEENLIIKRFDKKAFIGGNLIADFYNIIEPNNNFDFIFDKQSNESLGDNAIAFLKAYTEKYPKIVNNERNFARAINIVDLNLFLGVKDTKFSTTINFNEEEAKIVNESINYVNQFLEDQFKLDKIVSCEEPSYILNENEISLDFLRSLSYKYFEKLDAVPKFYENNLIKSKYYDNIEKSTDVQFFIELVNEVENEIQTATDFINVNNKMTEYEKKIKDILRPDLKREVTDKAFARVTNQFTAEFYNRYNLEEYMQQRIIGN